MKRDSLISQMNGNCSVHGWLFHFPVPLTIVAQSFPSTLFGSFLFQFSYFLLNPSLFGLDHFQSPSFAASEYPIQACSKFLDLTIISRSSFWISDAIETSSPFKLLQCLLASAHDFFSFTNWYNPEEFHHKLDCYHICDIYLTSILISMWKCCAYYMPTSNQLFLNYNSVIFLEGNQTHQTNVIFQ